MRLPFPPAKIFCLLALSGIALPLLSAPYARAQEFRGTIFGTVTDPTGAVIPGAQVVASGPSQTYTTTSRADGQFTIPLVDTGTYNIEVRIQGFESQTQVGIHVDVAAKISLQYHMKPGQITETMTVASDADRVNTVDASLGTVIDPEKVQQLPLNGRQLYSLLGLTPGVRFTTTQFGPGGNSGTRAWDQTNAYSINGQTGTQNQFSLNGAPVSSQGGGGAGTWNVAPSIDAVDQFKVQTNTYDAQYGRALGGAVNTVLKSGTDRYHGTAYDFWRNSSLDANTFQLNQSGARRPFHNQHQFGGTAGGFAIPHKTFFFFSFEGWREVLPVGVVTNVPTADLFPSAGGGVNLSTYLAATTKHNIYDPLTTRCLVPGQNPCTQYTRDQFSNNTIPANRISAQGLAILNLYPRPNVPGNTYNNNYTAADPGRYSYNQPMIRVDHNISDKTRLYGIYTQFSGQEYRNFSGLPVNISRGNINNTRRSWVSSFDVTHTFSPTQVVDVRIAWNRAVDRNPNGGAAAGLAGAGFTSGSLGIGQPAVPTTNVSLPPQINLNGSRFTSIIGNALADDNVNETFDLAPNFTQTLGHHTVHFGFEGELFHIKPNGIGRPNGVFSFSSGFTQQDPYQGRGDGDTIADLLLGYPDQSQNDGSNVQYYNSVYEAYKYYSAYIQDDWKVSPNLSLNLGIRWETETSPVERHNRLTAGFDLNAISPISAQLNGSGGIANPLRGGLQFPTSSFTAYENVVGNFLPKIGISYAPRRDLVIRGGFGIASGLGIELGGSNTFQQQTNYISSLDGGRTPTNYFNTGNPYPNGIITPPGFTQGLLSEAGNGVGFDQRARRIPESSYWSFGVQGAGPAHTIYDINYVGNYTFRQRITEQVNGLPLATVQAGIADRGAFLNSQVANPFFGVLPNTSDLGSSPTISQAQLLVPYPQFNGLTDYNVPVGSSSYDALQAKLEKRLTAGKALSSGLSVLASFTYSRTTNSTNLLNNGSNGYVDTVPYSVIYEGDRPWDFTLSGLYSLPFGRGQAFASGVGALTNEAVAGWQLEWIFSNDGGTPVGNLPQGFNYNCGGTYDFQVKGKRSYQSWIDNSDNVQALNTGGQATCLSNFTPYQIRTRIERTSHLRNPYAQQTQLSMEKQFPLKEGQVLQFKAEAFNLTNTPQFGGPNLGGYDQPLQRNLQVVNPNDPGAYSGFGTVSSQEQNFPRQIQLSLKYLF